MLGRNRVRLGKVGALICIGFFVLRVNACKETVSPEDERCRQIVFPDSNVSYGRHVEQLFFCSCAFSGCHDASTFNLRGFSLDSYDHLMFGTRPVVVRGEPENSPLVWRIEGRPGFIRMPLDRLPLTGNQIRGIRQWILDNAQNN